MSDRRVIPPAPTGPIRVLHVDDDPSFGEIVAEFLERADDRIEVETVGTASEGHERLDREAFDCVVSDYDMPETNGIDFLEDIRSNRPDLPFILYTGKGSEEVASDAITAGATDYLQKERGTDHYAVLANRIVTVVERERAQAATTQVQNLFRQLADRDNDVLWLYDREWTDLVFVSDAYEELFGQSIATLREEPQAFFEAVHPADRPLLERSMETLSSGEAIEIEIRVNKAEDYGRHVHIEADPITDASGAVTHVGGLTRDITDRKARERELVRAERQYAAIFEDPNILAGVLAPDGTVRDVNGTAMEYIDGDLTAVVGEPFWETPWWGDDDALQADVREWIHRAADGEYVPFETAVHSQSGKRIVRGVFRPVTDADGEVTAIVVSDRDITDRRTRERILREMYEIISNRERSFTEQIRALLELGRTELDTEYGTLSEIRGDEYVFEVVAADDDSVEAGDVVPLSATNCEITASSKETVVLGDIERDAPEETDRAGFAEWGIACYLGAPVFVDEEVYGTLCFYGTEPRDEQFTEWEVTLVDLMSRWVSYELQRELVTDRLHRQNEKLEQFASIVSHDLRNPLSVVDGSVELAAETGEMEHLERARNAVDRMNTLIDELLVLSRSGRRLEAPVELNVRSLLECCWENVPTAEATLVVETDRTVRGDESRLAQLFENLLSNAIEHGGPDVTITVDELDDGNGFYIADDGAGLQPGSHEEIFESGFTTVTDGTGFGLAIVEEIATAHGWQVTASDGADGGARFEFTGVEFADADE